MDFDVNSVADEVLGGTSQATAVEEGIPMWATDAVWVYEHVGGRPTKAKAGTPSRFELWKWAKEDTSRFMAFLQKATALLEAIRDGNSDTDMEKAERKSIQKLRDILTVAVEESKALR